LEKPGKTSGELKASGGIVNGAFRSADSKEGRARTPSTRTVGKEACQQSPVILEEMKGEENLQKKRRLFHKGTGRKPLGLALTGADSGKVKGKER